METMIFGNHASAEQVEHLGIAAMSNTNVNGAEGRLISNANGLESRNITSQFGFRTFDAIEKFGLYNAEKTEFYGLKNFEATKDALKDLMIQQCQDTAAIQLSSTINAKDAALAAAVNAAAIAKQLAECCCEQRELIRAQADETRALINRTNEDNLRDKLQLCRDEMLALRISGSSGPGHS